MTSEDKTLPVRALTVRAVRLCTPAAFARLDAFGTAGKREKLKVMEDTVCALRERFGKGAIRSASLPGPSVTAKDRCETVPMPGMMYRENAAGSCKDP